MRTQAKTLIEKHGFIDPDRKATKHDEIQLWVYDNINDVLGSLTSPGRSLQILSKNLEYPVVARGASFKMIAGYIDLFVSGNVVHENGDANSFSASIETKTKIESCGDLVRQINFYRSYQDYGTVWIVISPDDRFASVLKEQNIYFFKYKDPSTLF